MHSRSGGANRISSTLSLSSSLWSGWETEVPATKLGKSVFHTRHGPEVSEWRGKAQQTFFSSEKENKVCLSSHHHGNHSALPFRPKYRKWREVTFSITHPFRSPPFFLPPWPQTEISLVASIPKDSFYKNNRWQFWIEGRGPLGKDRPRYVGERGNAEEVTA